MNFLASLTIIYQSESDLELVVLSQVLAHACNIGYEHYRNMVVKKVNGTAIRNLQHLRSLMSKRVDNNKFLIEFSNGMVIVLDKTAAYDAQVQVI